MRNRLILFIIALILIITGVSLFKDKNSDSDKDEDKDKTELVAQDGERVVEGKIACLPLKSGAKVSLDDCVKGLETKDGEIYALNTTAVAGREVGMKVGQEVETVGKLEAADPSVDEGSVFRYNNLLVVRDIR